MPESEPVPTSPPPSSYADAVQELEQIIRALDATDVDVDQLAVQVARAADLIRFCRARLADAKVDVERIVASLGEPGTLPDDDEQPA